MANRVGESDLQRIRMRPSAEGTLSRLACARARAAGIDVAPLMVILCATWTLRSPQTKAC